MLVTFSFLFVGCIKALVLQNIKICIFSAMVQSEMIRFLKYDNPTS